MGARRDEVIRDVIIPAIAPNIFDGLKTSIVFAVIGALIGEFIAAKAGLGFYILNASGAFNINGIWVGVILIVTLVFVLTSVIGLIERRVLRWLPDLDSGKIGV
jgi:NitT/TauT family transport system permease protein